MYMSMTDVVCLGLCAETVESMHEQSWVSMVCVVRIWSVWYVAMLEFMLCCEILLLLNMVDMDRWKTVE